jgi:hypothetical protein
VHNPSEMVAGMRARTTTFQKASETLLTGKVLVVVFPDGCNLYNNPQSACSLRGSAP